MTWSIEQVMEKVATTFGLQARAVSNTTFAVEHPEHRELLGYIECHDRRRWESVSLTDENPDMTSRFHQSAREAVFRFA